jgi:hypothetical protein
MRVIINIFDLPPIKLALFLLKLQFLLLNLLNIMKHSIIPDGLHRAKASKVTYRWIAIGMIKM